MKKIIMFAVATMLTIAVFAKPGDNKKSTKKTCTTECKRHCSCSKADCSDGLCPSCN